MPTQMKRSTNSNPHGPGHIAADAVGSTMMLSRESDTEEVGSTMLSKEADTTAAVDDIHHSNKKKEKPKKNNTDGNHDVNSSDRNNNIPDNKETDNDITLKLKTKDSSDDNVTSDDHKERKTRTRSKAKQTGSNRSKTQPEDRPEAEHQESDQQAEHSTDDQDIKEKCKEEETQEERSANEEDEEEEREMTNEEKEMMYIAAKTGDIDYLEELMDNSHADINMLWYKENLLVAAIREYRTEMAEFLLDNGIDRNYEVTIIKHDPLTNKLEWSVKACRQMAYDRDMLDIVEIIDDMNGDLWPFLKPKPREPRLWRNYKERHPSDSEDSDSDLSDSDSSTVSEGSQNSSISQVSCADGQTVNKRKKKKRHRDDVDCAEMSSSASDETDQKASVTSRSEDTGVDGSTHKQDGDESESEDYSGSEYDSVDDGYKSASSPLSLARTSMLGFTNDQGNAGNHHSPTKAYLSRKKQISSQYLFREHSGNRNYMLKPVTAPGSYTAESRLWTPSVGERVCERAQLNQPVSQTRIMSPWKDDNPIRVNLFQRRKSYDRAVHVKNKSDLLKSRSPILQCHTEYQRRLSDITVIPLFTRSHSDLSTKSLTSAKYNQNLIRHSKSVGTRHKTVTQGQKYKKDKLSLFSFW